MRLAPVTRDRVLMQAVIILGVVLLLYPTAADWFSSRQHNSETSGYVQAVEKVAPEVRRDLLDIANDYNSRMPQGPLRDPYAGEISAEEEGAAYAAYERMLEASANGVIGSLVYEGVGVDLPIYHGTGEDVLAKGVGHLYGSSLPVGGPGTHSVLTSHSGLVHATLFSNMPKKTALGDVFSVDVLGEPHYYRVDQILTVLPNQTESLKIVANEDYITLITCTPIGINTHRLLVRGTRIPPPLVETEPGFWVPGDGVVAGFPWWAVGLGAGVFFSFAVFATRSTPRRLLDAPTGN
ncbi:class C sortase [Tessaracoccus antarcticus]|uniref:Class C sortase n=1 Tax=Tessaracoccus antarcticus TaxID=2479848 RepID=A0A3M0GGN5_9ACTN|nr:class C sortase [Tessaracoccus antarcticus]RMB61872.1 class C sortase [Tessaracoccus antarcticus]